MEQDIKIILNVIYDKNENQMNYIDIDNITPDKECKTFITAIEHLIKAYKELEEERQIVGMPVRNKRDGRIGIVLHQWKSGSVAVLESINPRVINTHDSWNTLEIVTDEVKQTQTKCETIPVSLVEEKIEEINKLITEAQKELGSASKEYTIYVYQKDILQELLEKRK